MSSTFVETNYVTELYDLKNMQCDISWQSYVIEKNMKIWCTKKYMYSKKNRTSADVSVGYRVYTECSGETVRVWAEQEEQSYLPRNPGRTPGNFRWVSVVFMI